MNMHMKADSIYSFEINELPKVLMLGKTERNGFWRKSLRTAASNILLIILKGKCSFLMDGDEYILIPGDVFFILKGRSYLAKTLEDTNCRFYFIHFETEREIVKMDLLELKAQMEEIQRNYHLDKNEDISIMPNISFQKAILVNKISSNDHQSEIFSLFEKAIIERDHFSLNSKHMITLFLGQILGYISKLTLNNLLGNCKLIYDNETPKVVQETAQFFRQHFQENITLKQLCEEMKVSPQYLIRVFNKCKGMSPIAYLNSYRISYAKDLIRHSQMSIKEICYEIGLENPHYFSRLFKKIEGISPLEFKKSIVSEMSYL